jgi:hypothetical protein
MRRALAGLAVIAAIAFGQPRCPIDDSSMAWTGRVEYELAKTLKEYKCLYGHRMWVVAQ